MVRIQIVGSYGTVIDGVSVLPGDFVEVSPYMATLCIETWKCAVAYADEAPAVVVETRTPKVRTR